MENTAEMSSSAMEQEPIDAIGSTENMLDCAASSLVQVIGSSQQHMATASSHSGDDVNQIGMDNGESIEWQLEEKHFQLVDVNDDCLRTIFEQLPILDLATVADVCKRFRSIAQETFELAKPTVQIPHDVCRPNNEEASEIADDENGKIIQRASRLFRNFGSLMTGLKVDRARSVVKYDERIVALIIKYCGQYLTALKLDLEGMHKLPIGLKPIVQKLKRVDFNSYTYTGIDASIAEWLTVVEDLTLSTSDRKLWNALFERSFENLRRIHFPPMFGIDCHDLSMFLDKNKTIKDLGIKSVQCVNNRKLKIPTHIENLRLVIAEGSYPCIRKSSFKNMKYLKSLELIDAEWSADFIPAIIHEIVAGDIQLKHLTLEGIVLDDDFEQLGGALSQLDHLDTLTLKYPFLGHVHEIEQISPMLQRVTELHLPADFRHDAILTIDDMVTIVSFLNNLQRFKVFFCSGDSVAPIFFFGASNFLKFVEIVQERRYNTRLDIELDRWYQLVIPKDLAQRHRHILSVKELKELE